jgi:hypothetical protein
MYHLGCNGIYAFALQYPGSSLEIISVPSGIVFMEFVEWMVPLAFMDIIEECILSSSPSRKALTCQSEPQKLRGY